MALSSDPSARLAHYEKVRHIVWGWDGFFGALFVILLIHALTSRDQTLSYVVLFAPLVFLVFGHQYLSKKLWRCQSCHTPFAESRLLIPLEKGQRRPPLSRFPDVCAKCHAPVMGSTTNHN